MIKNAVLTATLLLVTSFANGHHSSAMFDKKKIVEVTATVIEFQWTNPHVWIEIKFADDKGMDAAWSIEGLGPNSLFRNGWRPNSFKAGEVVEIRFNPMHDGSNAGGFIGAKFADGRTLGRWD